MAQKKKKVINETLEMMRKTQSPECELPFIESCREEIQDNKTSQWKGESPLIPHVQSHLHIVANYEKTKPEGRSFIWKSGKQCN